jgi:toxin ParE1/3/4
MARFKISLPAQDDLDAILASSEQRWGADARDRYAALLVAAMRKIAREPNATATKARDDVMTGVRSLHIRHAGRRGLVQRPVHLVFYSVTEADIEVVRVLHERMDPLAQIEPRRRK